MFHDGRFHVIPSVHNMKHLDQALHVKEEWVSIGSCHIGNLKMICSKCHEEGKKVIVNHEVIGGLGADKTAFELLRKMFGVDAVIGTSEAKLNLVRKEGLLAIRKIALIDSLAADQIMKNLKNAKYDAIELKPGLYAIEYLDRMKELYSGGYLISGFINTRELIDRAWEAGCGGVLTSNMELWGYDPSSGNSRSDRR